MNRQQQEVIDNRQEEVRVLKGMEETRVGKRLRLTDDQGARLARTAKVGYKCLKRYREGSLSNTLKLERFHRIFRADVIVRLYWGSTCIVRVS